jgi:hypothetical protein
VYRSGNRELAKSLFYKSCLYGTRSLILLRQGKFPIGYPEIFEASKKLELGEFAELVQAALEIRMGKREYDEMWLYKNIKYLNSFVEPQLMKEFSVKGNVMLLPSNLKNVVNLGKE